MQDQFAGDVGDYVKLGLLRALSPGHSLGVAWYRFPDETEKGDGKHLSYLEGQADYAQLDPELFGHLQQVVRTKRSISALHPILGAKVFHDEVLNTRAVAFQHRRAWRKDWFDRVLQNLHGCNLVFADPDNGIVDDDERRKGSYTFGKQIPMSEVKSLADGRCAVIYHHNTRRRGGHDLEIDDMFRAFDLPAMAVRATAYSPRTFFVLNPDETVRTRVEEFGLKWAPLRVRLHG